MLIRGLVADAEGDPIGWATAVFVEGPVALPDIAAVTDDAGRFTVAVPAAGDYRLACHAEGFEPNEVLVSIADSDIDVQFRLQAIESHNDSSGGPG